MATYISNFLGPKGLIIHGQFSLSIVWFCQWHRWFWWVAVYHSCVMALMINVASSFLLARVWQIPRAGQWSSKLRVLNLQLNLHFIVKPTFWKHPSVEVGFEISTSVSTANHDSHYAVAQPYRKSSLLSLKPAKTTFYAFSLRSL